MTTGQELDQRLIMQLADSITDAHSLEQFVRPLLALLESATGLESTYMTAIDEEAGLQHVLYARNSSRLQIPEGLSVPWGDTLCKRALEERVAYADDVADRWGDSGAARDLGIATYASTPIHGPGGRLYGTLCAASDTSRQATDDAGRILRMCSQLIGQQVEREWLMRELRAANHALATSALIDAATGLPNRRAVMEELPRRIARRDREHSALLIAFIDLDGFKAINDTHGHEAGDNMLALVADALSNTARAGDFCARLGGDEFVVLASIPATGSDAALLALGQRLDEATRGRFDLGGGIAIDYAGPSIGTILVPDDQHDVDAVLALADAAMYAAKRLRKANLPR
ncbi:MAG TPA: diguanylate cyclase [Thermomonas sp.]|nr:diguanylate cyclase [Thermomonas sp.]